MLQSEFWQDQIKVVLEERPPVITTGAGNPSSFMKHSKKEVSKYCHWLALQTKLFCWKKLELTAS